MQTEALATYVSIARLAMSMDEIERKPLPDAVGIHTNASDSRTDRRKNWSTLRQMQVHIATIQYSYSYLTV